MKKYSTLFIITVFAQSSRCVQLFAAPWTAAHQASLSLTISQVCPSSCPLKQWCHPTISSPVALFSFCLQSFPRIRVFSNEYPRFPLRLTGLLSLLSTGFSRVFYTTTVWKHHLFGTQPSLLPSSHNCTTTWNTIALIIWTCVTLMTSLLFNTV